MKRGVLSRGLASIFVLFFLCASVAPSFAAGAASVELNKATAEQLAATGAVDKGIADKIVQLREELGGFQSFDDLEELKIPADQMKNLQEKTSIQGISSDCNC